MTYFLGTPIQMNFRTELIKIILTGCCEQATHHFQLTG